MFFDNVFIVFYTLLASSGSVKYIELDMRSEHINIQVVYLYIKYI